jgi:hypothetical protein
MYVRPCPIGKITVIQNSRSSKTNKKIKKKAAMGVAQSVPHKLDQNSISPKINYDEDNDTPCYKDSLKIDGAAALIKWLFSV